MSNTADTCPVTDITADNGYVHTAGKTDSRSRFFFYPVLSLFTSVGAATVISPLELIRTKLQSQKQSYRELTACIRTAVEAEGWLSLWRGLGPTLLRDVPFSAMYWYSYDKGKRWLCEQQNTREPTFSITFTAGAVSGSVSAALEQTPLITLTFYPERIVC